MHCPICGTANSAQARFCLGCGHALVNGVVCRTCYALMPAYARFCSHCGDLLVFSGSACPHCGAYVAPGQPTCSACGNQVQSRPAAPPSAAPAAAYPPPSTPAYPPAGTGPPAPVAVPGPVPGVVRPVPQAPPASAGRAPVALAQLPAPRPIQELLPSLQRYLPRALYEPMERRPNQRNLEQVREHLTLLLKTAKTYLPRPVIEAPQPAGVPAGGMQRGVLLFGDVSGFTPLSEQLKKQGKAGAERITVIINDLFSDLVKVLFEHGGTLLKFGGDALLGLFPAQNEEEMAQSALRAVQAALAMQEAMGRFSAIEAAGETRALRIKCGVSSGPYFAAHIGIPQSMAYVTTGHTVNRAEQAEGHAKPGDVVITQDTLDLLNGQAKVELREEGFYLVQQVPPAEDKTSLESSALQEPPEGEVQAQITYLVDRLDRLSPYLSRELVSRIVTNPGNPRIAPDHRRVTVMFVNYVGISDLIEDMGETQPEVITEQLNRYFVHMAEIVERYEGTLARMDQYAVGDRLVIFFGAPRAHEDDPVRAVYTALDMQKATRDHFSALQTTAGIYRFRQRIGINTGALFAGNVGAPDLRQEYTLMGDDINMAARLMSNAGWQQIYLSKKTQERVAAFFELEGKGDLKVKGKEILIPTFEVRGRREEIGRTRGLEGGESPLIGRGEALAALQARGKALLAGHGQIVSIIGESGLGKSRLLREMKAWFCDLEEAKEVRWLEVQSLSFSEHIGYWLVKHMLRSALDLGPEANDDDVLFALWEMGEDLLAKEKAREAIPFLAHMMDLKLEGDWAKWVKELDPQVRQKQTFWAAREFIAAFARRHPTIIALDDLHWADEASLALLMDLLEVTVRVPLMFFLVFRPKRERGCWRLRDVADTSFHHRYAEVALEPLTEQDSRHLLQTLLTGADFAPETLHEILGKAEGNPFYLEEVVRSLIDSGAVEKEADTGLWQVTEMIDQISVPDSLQGAILSRIDRLTEDARQALQMAAVIGRRFQMAILSNLAEAETQVGTWLAQLERSDLIQPLDLTAEPAYIFPDALVHEVTYDNLLLQSRQQFHFRVGQVLEALLEEEGRLEQEPELLAYHFGRSNDMERAVKYLGMAASKARDEYANETAIQYYQQLYQIHSRRANLAGQADALYQMGVVAYKWGDYERARSFLERAIALRQEMKDAAGEGWSVMYLGMVYFMEGNYSEALKYHGYALQLAQKHKDTFQEGIHLTNLARVSLRLGEYEQALQQLEQSLEMKVQQDDLRGQGFSHYYVGLVHIYLGNYERADASLKKSLELRQELGDERETSYCLYGLGLLSLYRKQLEQAESFFRQAYEMSSRLDLKAETITNLSCLGQAYLALGRPEEARDASSQAVVLLEQQKSVEELQQIYLNHFRVLSAVGDPAAGEFLQKAHDAVMNQAYRIADREKRQAFLDQVRVNQEIRALVEESE